MNKFTPAQSSYFAKLKDPRWQKKRLSILERDHFSCRDCQQDTSELHVHHCFYDGKKEPWEVDDRFLLTLCATCHESRQEMENDCRRAIGFLFAQMSFDNLTDFTTGAVHLCFEPDKQPAISCAFEQDYLSDGRWFVAAHGTPKFRAMYECVTGAKPTWPIAKKKK